MTFKKMYPDENEQPGLTEWDQYGIRLPSGKIIWAMSEDQFGGQAVRVPGVDGAILLTTDDANRYGSAYLWNVESSRAGLNNVYRSSVRALGAEIADDVELVRVHRVIIAIVTNTKDL